jgi:hypothetical protein
MPTIRDSSSSPHASSSDGSWEKGSPIRAALFFWTGCVQSILLIRDADLKESFTFGLRHLCQQPTESNRDAILGVAADVSCVREQFKQFWMGIAHHVREAGDGQHFYVIEVIAESQHDG